ncbi:LSU ribosomal protein L4P [Raineyella antarctica]|uniref:Large ribosomal subunit protein uL4 n=1 Tax=Raineyella antarctica TaxID=1577474 RepID=A0A1G6HXG4_9ACTN|nr:50S ribosomal protein L4 [Raineyella antarctica]SDB98962.1 LSU ribosomal protein L4P [Raineyella antarctica]
MSTLTIDVLDAQGKKAGTADLPAEIFDVEPNTALIHQVVIAQLAAARQGTAKVKTRAEVSGGGKKPWRQKGTGRARHGSTRSPIWTGGGVSHGPVPRSYAQRTPKKMIAQALYASLTDRFRDGNMRVVTGFGVDDKPSTKAALASLSNFSEARKVLVVVNRDEELLQLSLRNAGSVHLLVPDQLNAYDVLNADDVVFTQSALDAFVGSRTAKEEQK